MPGTSPRPSISASNSRPGTGISSTWCGYSCSSASMSGVTAPKPWRTARVDLRPLCYKGRPKGRPFLFPSPLVGEGGEVEPTGRREAPPDDKLRETEPGDKPLD